MDLLGINLARARRCLEQTYNLKIAIHILLEMLVAILEVHDRGFIHRDVKASNFVLCKENRRVFIVDFGLAKKHLNNDMQVMPKRKKADFRGTVSFASLNAHNNIDLSRRDDLWSFYFTMLDFLNEKLEWREQRDYSINQVKDIKTKCLKNPKKKLWIGPTHGIPEVELIFNQIDKLQYQDRPDYAAIENLLFDIYNKYDMIESRGENGQAKWQLVLKAQPINTDLGKLKILMCR
jgi:serine/threonine protein kinase